VRRREFGEAALKLADWGALGTFQKKKEHQLKRSKTRGGESSSFILQPHAKGAPRAPPVGGLKEEGPQGNTQWKKKLRSLKNDEMTRENMPLRGLQSLKGGTRGGTSQNGSNKLRNEQKGAKINLCG